MDPAPRRWRSRRPSRRGQPGQRLGAAQPVPLAGRRASSRSCSGLVVGYVALPGAAVRVRDRPLGDRRVNLELLMVGRYPTDELLADRRSALIVLAGWGGCSPAVVRGRQVRAGASGRRSAGRRVRAISSSACGRSSPSVLLLLAMTTTRRAVADRAGVVVAAVVGRLARRRCSGASARRHRRPRADRRARRGPGRAVLLPRRRRRVRRLGAGSCSTSSWRSAGDRAVLPARRAARPRAAFEAAAHPGHVDGVHRARSAALPLFVLLLLANVALQFFFPRGSGAVEGHPGDRRLHDLHRRLHGRDRPRRVAVGAPRPVRGRQGARPVAGAPDVS